MKTKTVTINGFIVFDNHRHACASIYPQGPFKVSMWEPDKSDSNDVLVQAQSFTVEVPANFDPRPNMVKALQAKREKAHADFAALVTSIDRQINELQAIECSAEVANA